MDPWRRLRFPSSFFRSAFSNPKGGQQARGDQVMMATHRQSLFRFPLNHPHWLLVQITIIPYYPLFTVVSSPIIISICVLWSCPNPKIIITTLIIIIPLSPPGLQSDLLSSTL
ncbi:hypothetical protein BJX99DRAFT_147797 [Aspergillus californicus]